MIFRPPSHLHFLAICAAALFAACGDDATGKADGDDATSDSVVLPDTVRTETVDAIEDTEPEEISPGGFGAPCNTNADCDSGFCVDGPKGYVCTKVCETECPTGYDCKAISGGTDVVFLCLPRLKENCAPCAANFQCQGGICMQLDGQGRCEYRCTADADCPDGFGCGETEQAPGKFCIPSTGSCSCYEGADGGQRSCTVPSELGECVGIQECAPATGWSECSAHEPSPEVCDGQDNDCDGVWDDNLEGAGGPCVNKVDGVGECTGVQICLGVSGWLCLGPQPSKEVCNGIDDDCDGKADEDFKTEAGVYATLDNCGGCGVSCVESIPNAATTTCSGAGVTPRCEVVKCASGYYRAGPTTCLPIVDNSCEPCLVDEHCSVPGDLCLPLDGSHFCGRDCATGNAHDAPAGQCPSGYVCEDYSDTKGPGVRQCIPVSGSCTCLPGNDGEERPCTKAFGDATCFGDQVCDPTLGWSTCDAKTPSAETCNNADDNCNAVVDDVPGRFDACTTTNTFGACPGQLDCRAGSAALACVGPTPATEACNGRDDNCDGQTDNVAAPLCPKQLGVCAGTKQICAGVIGLLACNIGSYGTSYEVVETKCDGLDNDCDGETDDIDLDGDGHVPTGCGGDDCDDTDRFSYEGAEEICGDGADNDCDGTPENSDEDDDNFIAVQCGGTDCNDASALAHPGLAEKCGDLIDNDCDGSADNKDADHDTYLDRACGGPDCLDNRADVHPGATELCDSVDNNCNGQTDEKDADSDGFKDNACGGNDCDDTRSNVHPGGVEVCGNTIDENCSGTLDDRDLDGDGLADKACTGGTDCDDLNPQTKPGATEFWDAEDNDCDGTADEGVVPPGAAIITEVMGNTAGISDTVGEWFEVTNVSAIPVNLRGWQFGSIAGSGNDPGFKVSGNLVIAPGRTATFCTASEDNGGVSCDYEYSDVTFANGPNPDALTMSLAGTLIDGATFPAFTDANEGRARILQAGFYDDLANNTEANWCFLPTQSSYDYDGGGAGQNYGTPGAINPGDCNASPIPGVILVMPPNGIAAGGERVTLFGSGFLAGMSISIGGTGCSAPTLVGTTMLTCTTSSHAAGKVPVTVTVSGKTSAALVDGYTFTNTGNGSLTDTRMVDAVAYTIPSGSIGPIIVGSVTPGGIATIAQVGYGKGIPGANVNWVWFDTLRVTAGASDIYNRAFAIVGADTYNYAYRFSADGVTWRYTTAAVVIVTP